MKKNQQNKLKKKQKLRKRETNSNLYLQRISKLRYLIICI